MSRVKAHRIGPGYYILLDGATEFAELLHVKETDQGDGYGARDYWVLAYTDGGSSDPYPTKADALGEAQLMGEAG